MIGTLQPASRSRFLICGTAAAASGTFTVQRTISEPASANSTVCLNVASTSAVSVFVMDCTTMGEPPPTRTCPTFTPYVLRRGCLLAVASKPSICVNIPLNSSVVWPFRAIFQKWVRNLGSRLERRNVWMFCCILPLAKTSPIIKLFIFVGLRGRVLKIKSEYPSRVQMKARKQRRWQPRILRTLSLLGAILPGIIFSAANAKAHSKEETLSAKDRKEVFERIWKDVDEKYYDPKFNGVNWEDVRTRYEPKVALVKDDEEFYNLMKQMVEELHDAHTRFNTPNEWKNREKHQGVSLGFGVEQIEGKTVVNFVRPESEAESKGIKLGMVVQTLDGQPVAELLAASKNKRERNSSERADMLLAYRDIFSGPVDSTLKLGLQRADGSTFETSVTRTIYALPPKVEGKL